MTLHEHEDITRVVIGCQACITRVRSQEEVEQPEFEYPDDQPSLFESA